MIKCAFSSENLSHSPTARPATSETRSAVGAAAATHRLCLLNGRDSSRRTRSPGPHAFSSSCACAAAEEALRVGAPDACGWQTRRPHHVLLGLPKRLTKPRVAEQACDRHRDALHHLTGHHLRMLCRQRPSRGCDSSGARAVPTSERGMPATARRPLGRRKGRRPAQRDGQGAHSGGALQSGAGGTAR